MVKDFRKIFNLIENHLNNGSYELDRSVLYAIEQRNNGKEFSFNEHLKGLIYSLLSNQRNWEPIHKNKDYIEQVFFNFDKEKLKNADYNYFIDGLKAKSLANKAIKSQMENLKYNIEVFENIENKYGSLDYFITALEPLAVAGLFACSSSPHKLKQIGFPLALEYLRNVGIDTIKPDVHILRILKRFELLNESKNEEKDAVHILQNLADSLRMSAAKLDFLLWHYCSDDFGNICTANPKCEKCAIKTFCNVYIDDILLSVNFEDFANFTEKMNQLKQEFRNYITQNKPGLTKSTIDTYLGDAFYVFKHQPEFKTDFFDLFKSKNNIEDFEKELLEQQQTKKNIKKSKESTKAYKNGLLMLFEFFNKKYNGVENFINLKMNL